jgi:nucleoside-diphosphate-sugar epimerase
MADVWTGRRVFITGATGLLGTAVVEELLARGAEVVGLMRDRVATASFARHRLAGRIHIIHGRPDDLFRVHSALALHEVQTVFQLDGDNAAGATLLDAVRRFDPRVPVVCSRPGWTPTVVASPVPLGLARFEEVFGPEPAPRGGVGAMILAQLHGDRTIPADRGSRDLVHVRDAARACLQLAEAVGTQPTAHVLEANFRSGWSFSDRELHLAIREVLAGRTPLLPFAESPANPLSWSPELNFAEALADTVRWYRDQAPLRMRSAA